MNLINDVAVAAFRGVFTQETLCPDGTQPMADNPILAASSSSTTTVGELSFAEDPRAFYNKETGTWRLEDDDGNELEYDQTKGAWIPLVSKLDPPVCPQVGRGDS